MRNAQHENRLFWRLVGAASIPPSVPTFSRFSECQAGLALISHFLSQWPWDPLLSHEARVRIPRYHAVERRVMQLSNRGNALYAPMLAGVRTCLMASRRVPMHGISKHDCSSPGYLLPCITRPAVPISIRDAKPQRDKADAIVRPLNDVGQGFKLPAPETHESEQVLCFP